MISQSKQSRSVFKEFLIVGVTDYDALEAVASNDVDKPFPTQSLPPTLLYSHVKQGQEAEECDRRRVIKDFCFPCGI